MCARTCRPDPGATRSIRCHVAQPGQCNGAHGAVGGATDSQPSANAPLTAEQARAAVASARRARPRLEQAIGLPVAPADAPDKVASVPVRLNDQHGPYAFLKDMFLLDDSH